MAIAAIRGEPEAAISFPFVAVPVAAMLIGVAVDLAKHQVVLSVADIGFSPPRDSRFTAWPKPLWHGRTTAVLMAQWFELRGCSARYWHLAQWSIKVHGERQRTRTSDPR